LDSKEQKRDVDTIKFLENIARAQNKIAKNGNNNFTINADTNIPSVLQIPKISFQIICYNLISNTIKHTNNGSVDVNLSIPEDKDLNDARFIH
jgi:signal transduction histidine kinase